MHKKYMFRMNKTLCILATLEIVVFTIFSVISIMIEEYFALFFYGAGVIFGLFIIFYGLTRYYFTDDGKIVKKGLFRTIVRDVDEIMNVESKNLLPDLGDFYIVFKDGKKWNLIASKKSESIFREHGVEIVKKPLSPLQFDEVNHKHKSTSISKTSVLLMYIIGGLELIYVYVAAFAIDWDGIREQMTLLTVVYIGTCILAFLVNLIIGYQTVSLEEDQISLKNIFFEKKKMIKDIVKIEKTKFMLVKYYTIYFNDEVESNWSITVTLLSERMIKSFWLYPIMEQKNKK